MDNMALVMMKQGKQIEDQAKTLKQLKAMIGKEETSPEPEAVDNEPHPDDNIPDLFSIRRSPYYQGKINSRVLNHPILRTKRNVKRTMAKTADFYGWNRKAEAEKDAQDNMEF